MGTNKLGESFTNSNNTFVTYVSLGFASGTKYTLGIFTTFTYIKQVHMLTNWCTDHLIIGGNQAVGEIKQELNYNWNINWYGIDQRLRIINNDFQNEILKYFMQHAKLKFYRICWIIIIKQGE